MITDTFEGVNGIEGFKQVSAFLNISQIEGKVCLSIQTKDSRSLSILLDCGDIPAVALSALKVSGVEPMFDPFAKKGTDRHLSHVFDGLLDYVTIAPKVEAEERELKELEGIAFELLKARRAFGGKAEGTWEDTHPEVQEEFLVLATSAKEMGATSESNPERS